MTKDEAFREYTEALNRIEESAKQAIAIERAKLKERLEALRIEHHQELKAIRAISQRTKGRLIDGKR